MDVNYGTVTYDQGVLSYNSIELGNIYNNLTFNNPSGVWNLNSALTLKGSLNIAAGIFNASHSHGDQCWGTTGRIPEYLMQGLRVSF